VRAFSFAKLRLLTTNTGFLIQKQSGEKIIFIGFFLYFSFYSLGKVGFSPHHGRIFRLILRLLGLII
jgi:hypothetical protein